MLDYREYIYAVYRHRSFSRAAEELHVSQPWLSATVKKTEQALQLKLFDRASNPISLTEAGRYYIEQVERIMAIEAQMGNQFALMRASSGGTLRIGSSMFFCTYVLPRLLAEFRERNPQISITFVEGNTGALVEKLRRGELDLILEVEEIRDPKITTVPWTMEELVLAVPAGFAVNRTLSAHCYTFEQFLKRDLPGNEKPPVSLAEFRDEPFLLLTKENDLHQRSLRICRNADFSPKIKLLLTQLMTAYYLVCEGQGVTFLRSAIPEYVAPTESIVFYQLGDPLSRRHVYFSYMKHGMKDIQRSLIRYMEGHREL